MRKVNKSISKNISRYAVVGLLAASVLTLASSCEKWLEEDPYSLYVAETYFKTVDDAKKATLGVYETMSKLETYGFYMSLVYDIDSDIGHMDGTGLSNDNRTIAHYNVSPGHNYTRKSWTSLYNGIDRANLAIAKIPAMDLYSNGTEAQKKDLKRCLAEVKFLRGMYYFDLVRLFGDVPLKLKFTEASDDLKLARTDRETVYDQIITDMKEAIDDIPEVSQKVNDERVSKGAVKGILARVYLYRGGYSLRQDGTRKRPANYKDYYAETARLTKEIMESGEHSLNLSFENIFRNYCTLKLEPKESMFEVAFYNATGDNDNSSYVGSWNSPICDAAAPFGRANSFYKVSPLFYKKFAATDTRKKVTIATFQITATGDTTTLKAGTNNDRKWAPGKWRRNWQGTSPKSTNNTDLNWTLLRYSDVLLMRAEAEWMSNNEQPNVAAYLAINQVRRRAYGLPLGTVSAVDIPTTVTGLPFFEKIKEERVLELAYEGLRKGDLIRWNILGETLRSAETALKAYSTGFPYIAGTYFVDNKHELYPIPTRERELNINLTQNPNY
ncbi:RagB/SusD family nutrient uptake outer membrane protein [Pedobacter arcticus]|uniref:RagB/SusD family nutrient uptake outer membrane protein n=1 Tax=Pedobacter arcticus TaxID=752140 RepID=UPI00030CDA08|nr:RagB/SusD family nutrient uptake outer membrane protein [Pedobacter arcticus]